MSTVAHISDASRVGAGEQGRAVTLEVQTEKLSAVVLSLSLPMVPAADAEHPAINHAADGT